MWLLLCIIELLHLPLPYCQVAGFPLCGLGALKDVSHDVHQVPITSVAKSSCVGRYPHLVNSTWRFLYQSDQLLVHRTNALIVESCVKRADAFREVQLRWSLQCIHQGVLHVQGHDSQRRNAGQRKTSSISELKSGGILFALVSELSR